MMKRSLLAIMLLGVVLTTSAFTVVEYNCENLFDCEDDSLKEDEAFLKGGMYNWTHARYWNKVNNIARTIISCGEKEDGTYMLPDLVMLCEIENDSVMRDLTKRSLMRNADYEYIMTNSPDLRGVDVALVYSPYSFVPIKTYSLRVEPLNGMRPTRDILYVNGRTKDDEHLHVFVVHAPSRSGGELQTRKNRRVVGERLAAAVDSVYAADPQAKIIIGGDFNDYSKDDNLKMLQEHNLTEVSAGAKGRNGAQGTYKYAGEWESLDHIFLSPQLAGKQHSCYVKDDEFLLKEDEVYGGMMPFRNFRGPVWQNGFSDHLPLVLNY